MSVAAFGNWWGSSMKVLFVHNNFPAQFRNVVEALKEISGIELAAIGAEGAQVVQGVAVHRYAVPSIDVSATHPFARRFDAECWRAEHVLMAASALASSGFVPDVILAHCGWGEALPLRAAFTKARLVVYCEFFYRGEGQDVHFDPEGPRLGVDGLAALRCKNASSLLALTDADAGISPTRWQRSTFPQEFHGKIQVAHEGVDLQRFRPNPAARFSLPSGKVVTKSDEIVTFASRNLEPVRGYHVLMRALPEILRARPEAQIVIAGGDGNSYSHAPPAGRSWKTHYLDAVISKLDLSRVHFVGRLAPDAYLSLLQVSSAHVYLTYPFVLSWSLLEAMATECRNRRFGHGSRPGSRRGSAQRRPRSLHRCVSFGGRGRRGARRTATSLGSWPRGEGYHRLSLRQKTVRPQRAARHWPR